MLQKTLLFLLLSIILILVKADKDNPLDYLKDAFDIVRPSYVISDESEPSWLEPELELKDFQLGSARLVTFFSSARNQKSAETS
jgi:hypothetical protein